MQLRWLTVSCAALLVAAQSPLAPEKSRQGAAKTKVIVLGVEHSAQLVSKTYRAAVFDAFLDRVRPDAICIERDPELAAADYHYEFTYEITDIALPYAAARRLALCPIDWTPTKAEMIVAFRSDLKALPVIRPKESFVTFRDRTAIHRDLLWAEDRTALGKWDAFADSLQASEEAELARRLFLYRTAMQARRISAAARARQNQTILVLVGAFHERDIENFLKQDASIEVVQAAVFGLPAAAEAARYDTSARRLAVLIFNLLGQQSETGTLDLTWMQENLDAVEGQGGPTLETRLLRIRLDRLIGKLAPAAALSAYRRLIPHADPAALFSWSGVRDGSRLDSYFDPFGNATILQRLNLEVARELYALGRPREAEDVKARVEKELPPSKRAQLAGYWHLLASRQNDTRKP
jgi:hypothetical protein